MKTSNKVLFGGLGLVFLIGIIAAGITRSSAKIYSKEACGEMSRSTKNLQLEFNKIEISQNINTTLIQGNFAVQIDATDEVMPNLNHHVENGVLKIYLDDGNYIPCPVNVVLTCPQLDGMIISNGSSIVTKGAFKTPNIEVSAMNGSQVELELESDFLKTKAQNSADVRIKGLISKMDVTAHNSARVQAPNAKVNNAIIRLTNSSSAMIFADTISEANLTNSASLKYVGDAQLGNIQTNNSSSIRKISEDEAHTIQDKWR